ncbi:twitching motility protein PilT [Sulfitobacter sp. SK012]|uniref:DUF1761 domain-containing protein n=1 Tax=Sulfitobacter sp. SK012 TaxID=1389005 RepID=UPI000E0B6009|nr:DUF1761 domain-containing protein [Sulfitobacter sp. SK012]AXI48515.1 twitching motility protein PilT [Sulfitobacter sp. SK012]
MDIALMNWTAIVVGTIAAFGLGMIWFSPMMFGKSWAAGSHNIQPPASPPIMAMVIQFVGTALLALVVGITETNQAIMTAVGAILAVTFVVAGMDLFSQKSGKATVIDAGYVVASGALMILAQGLI